MEATRSRPEAGPISWKAHTPFRISQLVARFAVVQDVVHSLPTLVWMKLNILGMDRTLGWNASADPEQGAKTVER